MRMGGQTAERTVVRRLRLDAEIRWGINETFAAGEGMPPRHVLSCTEKDRGR